MMYRRHGHLINCLILVSAWLLFSYTIIKVPSGPLEGKGDLSGWEYSGFFLLENLRFTPWPSIEFVNDTTFFPFGVTAVFQAWGLERDYFYALMRALFGFGPWLQLYFALSYLLTAVVSYYFVQQHFGKLKGLWVGLAVPFLSAYAFNKYPHHFGIGVFHWAAISIVVDFLIAHSVVAHKRLPLKLVLVRILLVVLSLGQEIAYIAGLSLSSAIITGVCFLAYMGFHQELRVRQVLESWRREFQNNRKSIYALGCAIMVATFFLVPLILQIFLETRRWETPEMLGGSWWAKPRRIFLPFFESAYANNFWFFNFSFRDSPEGFGAASPGWFLLMCGTIGLIAQKSRCLQSVPLMILFGLILFYHPFDLPTMKYFPWYKYARVAPRLTIILPTILALFALGISLKSIRFVHSPFLIVLALVGLWEIEFMYRSQAKRSPEIPPSAEFFSFMKTIKDSPGEALFEWPFCIWGGNGGGACGGEQINSSYALRKYHTKKVTGAYYGRISSEASRTYVPSGIASLIESQKTRCLYPEELDFLYDFYVLNDFAGINIYLDLINPKCHQFLFKKFGQATAKINLPAQGKAVYIKKTKEELSLRNPSRGKSISYLVESRLRWGLSLVLSGYPNASFKFDSSITDVTDFKNPRDGNGFFVTTTEIPARQGNLVYRDQSVFVYSNSNLAKETVSFDFIENARFAAANNIISDVLEESGYLYTHPDYNQANLEFKNVRIPENSQLNFGLLLKNTNDGVRFGIKIDGKSIYQLTLKSATYIQKISVDLSPYFGKKVSISFIVDPLDDNALDWAYWQKPQIAKAL